MDMVTLSHDEQSSKLTNSLSSKEETTTYVQKEKDVILNGIKGPNIF